MEPFYWKTSAGDTTISRLRYPRKNHSNFKGIKVTAETLNKNAETIVPEIKYQLGSLRDLVDNFGENTSLMGVMQVASRKGLPWKIFWVVITLSAAAMAIYQSWNILQDFVGGKTVQSTTYSAEFDFPSVTICSNIHVAYSKKDRLNETELLAFQKENMTMLVDMLQIIIQKENETGESLFGANKFVKHCLFNRKSCDKKDDNDFLYFETLMFGNCFTFNPGLKEQKRSRPNYYVQLTIHMEANSRKREYNHNYALLWLHPPGTSPVLYITDSTRIYPGDSISVKFQMKNIVRLPKSDSICVSATEDVRRFQSIYYTNDTEYLYTSKACVYSLIYEAKKAMYNCVDPAVPRNDKWWHDWFTGDYSICLPGTNRPAAESEDDNQNETFFDFEHNCTFPCNEWMTDYYVTSTSAWFEALIDKSLKNSTDQGSNRFDTSKSDIRISLGSPMTEAVNEDYKYTAGDFAGIIGGNIGFWAGLCAISMMEIIELLVHLFVRKLSRVGNTLLPTTTNQVFHDKTLKSFTQVK